MCVCVHPWPAPGTTRGQGAKVLAALDYMFSEGSLEADLEDAQLKLYKAVRTNDTTVINQVINNPAVKVRTTLRSYLVHREPERGCRACCVHSTCRGSAGFRTGVTCVCVVAGCNLGLLSTGCGRPSDAPHGLQDHRRRHPHSGSQEASHFQELRGRRVGRGTCGLLALLVVGMVCNVCVRGGGTGASPGSHVHHSMMH